MPKVERKRFRYEETAMLNAVNEVIKSQLSIRAASVKYGVPRATLQDKINGKTANGPRKMGPNTILTVREEETLVQWMISLTKCGFPRKPDDLLNTVQNIIRDDERQNPFTDNRPGKSWYKLFLRRHPELSLREAEGISGGRAVVTEQSIRKWFTDLENYMQRENAGDVLLDPKRIFNCDETSFSMCPKTGKVIAPKGWKNVYTVQKGSEKETITCLFTFSASGETVTPMVVFPYVRLPKDIISTVPDTWFIGKSETGWMRSETFFEFIANGFNQWITQSNIKKPVLLLVDGHKSHLTMELSQFCHDNQIILYSFLPNCTHILQMADVSIFKSLKSDYKKTVLAWQRRSENLERTLTKTTFCPMIATVLQEKDLSQAIRNGFRATGIYPFNPDAVDYSKCVQNTIENLNAAAVQKPSIDDLSIASNVINYMRDILIGQGINVDAVLQAMRNETPAEHEPQCVTLNDSTPISQPLIEFIGLQEDELEISELDSVTYVFEDKALTSVQLSEFIMDVDDATPTFSSSQSFTSTACDPRNESETSIACRILQPIVPVTSTCELKINQAESGADVDDVKSKNISTAQALRDITNYSDQTKSNIEGNITTSIVPDLARAVQSNSQTHFSNHVAPNLISPIGTGFTKHLFYPKPISSGKKRKEKLKTPMAVSAPEWRAMKQRLEDEKKDKIEAVEKRKKERLEKAKLKSEALEKRKEERIEKARIKTQLTLKRLNDKLIKLQSQM